MLKSMKSAAKLFLKSVGLTNDANARNYIQRLLHGETMVAADVGAAGWLPEKWQNLEGGVEFLFFEPHPESYEKLVAKAKQAPYPDTLSVFNTALSGSGGKRTLYMLNTPTGSSLMPVNMESEFVQKEDSYIFPITEKDVDTRSLADVLGDNGRPLHMLKLDVQGAELEILEGMGQQHRDELVMVESEVNMAGGGHIGAPTFHDLQEILHASGMRLYDVHVVRNYRKKYGNKFWYHKNLFNVYNNSPSIAGRTWEFDVIYFADYRPLMDRGDLPRLRRLLVALCAYRYFNEAYFVVETCEAEGVIDSPECEALKTAILSWHNSSARQFWYGRSKAMQLLRSVVGFK